MATHSLTAKVEDSPGANAKTPKDLEDVDESGDDAEAIAIAADEAQRAGLNPTIVTEYDSVWDIGTREDEVAEGTPATAKDIAENPAPPPFPDGPTAAPTAAPTKAAPKKANDE